MNVFNEITVRYISVLASSLSLSHLASLSLSLTLFHHSPLTSHPPSFTQHTYIHTTFEYSSHYVTIHSVSLSRTFLLALSSCFCCCCFFFFCLLFSLSFLGAVSKRRILIKITRSCCCCHCRCRCRHRRIYSTSQSVAATGKHEPSPCRSSPNSSAS